MRDVSGFSLASVFAEGTTYYVRNLSLILPLSLLAFTPAFVVMALGVNDAFRFDLGPVKGQLNYPELTSLVCGVWLQAGLSLGVMCHLEGGYSRHFGEILIDSIRSLIRCAHVAFGVVAVFVVGFLVFVWPSAVLANTLVGAVSPFAVAVFGVGFVAGALAGLVLATILWVAVPSVAVEHRGVVAALRRSYELTRNHRARILGLLIIFVVIGEIAGFVVSLVFTFLVPGGLLSPEIGQQIGEIVTWGLVGTVAVVSYHDLRVLKEGAASKAISRAFE